MLSHQQVEKTGELLLLLFISMMQCHHSNYIDIGMFHSYSTGKILAAFRLEGNEARGNTPPESDPVLEDSMENIVGHHLV